MPPTDRACGRRAICGKLAGDRRSNGCENVQVRRIAAGGSRAEGSGAMIAAVLWDFGGVVTASPFDAFNAYERAHGIPENFIRRINATNPHDNAWAKFERSEVDLAEFSAAFEAESAAAPAPGGVLRG